MIDDKGLILIIDNNQDDIALLSRILTDEGYSVKSYSCLDYPEETISGIMPDCIILSLDMLVITGTGVFDSIKSVTGMKNIPVILSGSDYSRQSINCAEDLTFTDYLMRPFREWEVAARIKNYVSFSRMKKKLDEHEDKKTVELRKTNELLMETVEEYKLILKDLQDNETLLLTIALNIPNSYLAIIEKDYTIGFASGHEFKKHGLDPWRLVGLPISKVFREQTDAVKKYFAESFSGRESSFEILFNDQYLLYKTVPLPDSSGEIQRILTVAENITERKISENHIRESLHEKETLLKEIHHRVKNNLQIISSLLSMQTENSTSAELQNTIKTLQNRIFSMSLVHEKLYHYKQFSKINFREYIKDLIGEIKNSFNGEDPDKGVRINITADNVYLSIEKAIPSGLVLNELIMNSFKHAFVKQGEGEINIGFSEEGQNCYTLSVKDNGRGLPHGFDFTKTESTGMVLIRELVGQLHGSLNIENRDGAEFIITFGVAEKKHETRDTSLTLRDKKGVLIVEDERIISTMLKKIIEDQGYRIIACVASGKDAIRYALETRPDLILMDIVLEDEIDGVEAARVITGEMNVPVIFLTGNSDALTLNAARNTMPFDMLTKPVRRANLVEVINSAINR